MDHHCLVQHDPQNAKRLALRQTQKRGHRLEAKLVDRLGSVYFERLKPRASVAKCLQALCR
eukprot:scaffold857_cov152-Ochromonas_danica.AAC.13